ncbi:LacI family DNA-binding transcriptional regulator [Anaerococcus sp. mt242]|uniref:LacI family DNA-binding transcriptional regulator n=1 Tax=Anaerococcus sp. mt242 TaxID=2661917 RepID=UPI0019329F3A|nr:LacI family DNA-binding transcriptional regulator [Anaerococcus sp. mt242]MBM0045705.1 LacI family DNA-binding transcriptional regulator [Anaerococcus sp. mt242]
MGQPTIKDVAKLAGVSISTVSRVMNNSKPVSPEARQKVLDAITKLDFKPNELARSLVMRRSNLVGVIVEDIGIEYMAQLIRGVEEIGRVYKYDILLQSSYGSEEALNNSIDFLATKQVEGLIIITENLTDETLIKLRETRIPFILLDKYHAYKNLNTVKIDYLKEQYKLTKYLYDLGHESVLYIGNEEDNVLNNAKLQGYNEAVNDLKKESFVLKIDGLSSNDGYNIGKEAINLCNENNITAVSLMNDEVAIGFIDYCADHGIKVPDKLSVTGFGDASIASIYRPNLTTVSIPYYDIGAIAIRALIKRIKKEDEILLEDWVIECNIVARESSK